MEQPLWDELVAQAETVGLPPGTYLERLLADLHCYDGRYVAKVAGLLPTPISIKTARRLISELQPGSLPPSPPKAPSRFVRVDLELAQRIEDRCDELQAGSLRQYLVAVLRLACGMPLQPAESPVQESAILDREGNLRLATAS